MLKKSILAFGAIIAGLTLAIIAPSLTVQQALASHSGSDPKADEKASKTVDKALVKEDEGKLPDKKAETRIDKISRTCGGDWDLGPPPEEDVHCTGTG